MLVDKLIMVKLNEETRKRVLAVQRNEITEHLFYQKLAEMTKETANKKVLKNISESELKHYNIWKNHSGEEVGPNNFELWKNMLIARIFGVTFGIKLMEGGEKKAQATYEKLAGSAAAAREIEKDESKHEKQLIGLIDEERLKYVGAMVLGLNDALVELTGALAGFTFTLQNTHLIAIIGLITGIAATMSMAASEYQSTRAEVGTKDPTKAAVYTGVIYLATVLLLIIPYFLFNNVYLALGTTILEVLVLISVFTFYISVVKELSFPGRFLEMASISLGIAAITFMIGFVAKSVLNIQV
jgi:VIT1/CCC1 family predicted Fe2+/Mn2+ transporter